MRWAFWRKRRHARYVFRLPPTSELLPQPVAYDVLTRFTPVIGARAFNRLPEELQKHFIKVGKP